MENKNYSKIQAELKRQIDDRDRVINIFKSGAKFKIKCFNCQHENNIIQYIYGIPLKDFDVERLYETKDEAVRSYVIK